MFWKSDKNSKSWSLTTKLMALYAISTISILLAMSIFLYPTFINIIDSINHDLGLVNICYKKIVVALLLSSLLAIVVGYLIARNGVKKIHAFSDTIENITASSLHQRIDPNDWPKEFKSVGLKFNNMLDRLETSFKQLSQFSSDIAHELRNPLHNLKGITELALSSKATHEEQTDLLQTAHEEYDHLTKLIEHLLFLAQIDHGQLVLQKESIKVREIILKICDYFASISQEKNIEVICTGDAIIQVDLILFQRMINNLLSNALKYTPPGGKIIIEIKQKSCSTQVKISDSGIGIPSEHLSRIFDRFYRVDSSRATHRNSLGLGLAIVKSIIELHGGTISIESEPNKGTGVYLAFPITNQCQGLMTSRPGK